MNFVYSIIVNYRFPLDRLDVYILYLKLAEGPRGGGKCPVAPLGCATASVRVYKLPCKDCDLAYIGETGQSLKIRMKQNESNCRNHSNPSAVVNHHELGHSIDNSC